LLSSLQQDTKVDLEQIQPLRVVLSVALLVSNQVGLPINAVAALTGFVQERGFGVERGFEGDRGFDSDRTFGANRPPHGFGERSFEKRGFVSPLEQDDDDLNNNFGDDE